MTRHSAVPILPYHKVISGSQKCIVAPTIDTAQNTVTARYVRFKVAICLYLSPSNKASSLSTLIAVTVSKDTENKI